MISAMWRNSTGLADAADGRDTADPEGSAGDEGTASRSASAGPIVATATPRASPPNRVMAVRERLVIECPRVPERR